MAATVINDEPAVGGIGGDEGTGLVAVFDVAAHGPTASVKEAFRGGARNREGRRARQGSVDPDNLIGVIIIIEPVVAAFIHDPADAAMGIALEVFGELQSGAVQLLVANGVREKSGGGAVDAFVAERGA